MPTAWQPTVVGGSLDLEVDPLRLLDSFFPAAGDVGNELGEPVDEGVVVGVGRQGDATPRTGFVTLSHVELGHNEDPAYESARMLDEAAGSDQHRELWEIDADSLTAALVESIESEMTDANASLSALSDDVDRYS